MPSGNHPNNNFPNGNLPLAVPPVIITPEQYEANLRYMQHLRQQVEFFSQMNRDGFELYRRAEVDLSRRVAEGERARQQLQQLHQLPNMRAIAGPSTALGNRVGPLPNTNVNFIAYHPPVAVPPTNFVNGNNAFLTNTREAHISYPSFGIASSSSQHDANIRVQQPAPNPSTISGQNVSQAMRQQRRTSNTTLDVPLSQRAPPSSASNQTVAPMSASYAQHQGYPNASANTVPPKAGVQIPQTQPNMQQASFYQVPVATNPFSLGPGQGISGSGPGHQTHYPSSSSSLAGALRETSSARSAPDLIRRTTTESPPTAGEATSHVQQTTASDSVSADNMSRAIDELSSQTNTGTASAVLKSMSDEQFMRAQKELASIGQSQLENNLDSLPKQRQFSTHPSNESFWPHSDAQRAQDEPSVLGGSSSVSFANISRGRSANDTRASQAAVGFATQSGVSSSTFESVPLNYAANSGSQWSESNVANVSHSASAARVLKASIHFSAQRPEIFSTRNIQDYYSAAVASQNANQAQFQVVQEHPNSHHQLEIGRFGTPPPDKNRPPGPITPASANKKTLAKDILWALNKVPEKRKTSTTPESSASDVDLEPPPSKRHGIEFQPTDIPVMDADVFTIPSTLPVETHNNSARIEEINEDVGEGMGVEDALATMGGSIPGAGNPELVPITVTTSDIQTVPDSLPSHSAVESRASSEAEVVADTALQPIEDPSVPLFLPDPEISSTPSRERRKKPQESVLATSSLSLSAAPAHKPQYKKKVYVEVPILTEAKRQLFFLKKDSEHIMANEPSTGTAMQEESEVVHTSVPQANIVDESRHRAAQEVAAVAASRLRKRPCLWNDCFHVANSANSLKVHVLEHIESIPDKERRKYFRVGGENALGGLTSERLSPNICGTTYGDAYSARIKVDITFYNTTIFSMHLITDCEAAFGSSLDLLAHVETNHSSSDNLRPSVKPVVPMMKSAPPLGIMFAYHVINLPVQTAEISPERRARLGPWVAKNCFGNVNLGAPKYNARNQPQRRRAVEDEPKLLGDWQDRYDFLELWPTKLPPNCANLESAKATEEIECGLVLLPDKAGPQGPLREQLLTSRADRLKLPDNEKYEVKAEYNPEEHGDELSEIKVEALSPVVSQEHEQHPRASSHEPSIGYSDFLGVGEPQPVIMSPA
ncbi:hypothetical protein A7U60_g7678 [Sanghuangporus baumii]|uniref:Uncharacterized protein n=1 Tax=Sanghuangporus baumii TaxID=108892 RepID=A0A9Q5N9F7_SANBA|nr:hypothetical protein A7U60_g7678 [Sanghuangporus baumii]